MNRLCLAAGVTLIESGSAGYLGQVSVIRKVSKDPHLNTCICACTVLVYTIVHVYIQYMYIQYMHSVIVLSVIIVFLEWGFCSML